MPTGSSDQASGAAALGAMMAGMLLALLLTLQAAQTPPSQFKVESGPAMGAAIQAGELTYIIDSIIAVEHAQPMQRHVIVFFRVEATGKYEVIRPGFDIYIVDKARLQHTEEREFEDAIRQKLGWSDEPMIPRDAQRRDVASISLSAADIQTGFELRIRHHDQSGKYTAVRLSPLKP